MANKVLAYERDQYGPSRIRWRPGFLFEDTNNGVTRYVTHGAGVSVPSENKGFYFSGKRGLNWGEISNPAPVANVTANTLISLDMSQMRSPEWANSTFPDHIPGRAAGELVWIPVSASGALIAIGGVPYPQDISNTPVENIMRDMRENVSSTQVYILQSDHIPAGHILTDYYHRAERDLNSCAPCPYMTLTTGSGVFG